MNTKYQPIPLKTSAVLCLAVILLAGTVLTTFAAPLDRTWTGNGGLSWGAANWNEGSLSGGDFLIYPSGSSNPANTNDLAGRVVGALTFGVGTSGYALGGAWFSITNGITNSAGGANTISNIITFAAPSAVGIPQATQTVWNAQASGSGALIFKGTYLTNSTGTATNYILFDGPGDFGISNVIVGSGSLIKKGAGVLTLGGANTYGPLDTFLWGGILRAATNNVIPNGNSKGNLNISNATFDLNGTGIQSVDGLNGDSTAVVNNSSLTAASILSIGNGASNSFWGGNITDPNYASGGFVNVSNNNGGTTSFTNANSYRGYTRVQGGTFVLTNTGTIVNSASIIIANGKTFRVDNNSVGGNLPDRIGDSANVVMDNGVLVFANNAAAGVNYSETIGTLVLSNAQGRVDMIAAAAGQTSTFTINNVTRLGSGWASFTLNGGPLTLDPRNRITIVNPGPLTNVASAPLFPGGPSSGIIPFAGYTSRDELVRWVGTNGYNGPVELVATDYSLNIPESQWAITNNLRLGYGQTMTGNRVVNSLNLGASAVAHTLGGEMPLDLGGNSLGIASGALMFSGDTSGFFQITNGTLTAGISPNTPAELVLLTRNTGYLHPQNFSPLPGPLMYPAEINASITDNGTGPVTVTKIFGNLMVLSGSNTYSGGTTIANGGGFLMIGNGGTSGTAGSGDITNYAELHINRSDDITFPNAIRGTGAVRKYNTNTVVFTADSPFNNNFSVYSGAVPELGAAVLAGNGRMTNVLAYYLRRGTLMVSNTASANLTDRLADGKGVNFEGSGSALIFTNDGSAANYSESVGQLIANYGSGTVVAAPPAPGYRSQLTFTSWARNNNSTMNITGAGLGTNVTAGSATNVVFLASPFGQQNGTANPASVISGNEFAKYVTSTSLSVTSAMPLQAYDYAINTVDSTWTGAQNVKLTTAGTTALTGAHYVNTLNLAQTAGMTLDVSAGSLNVSNAGILVSGDYPASITGGTLNGGVAELIFHVMIPTNSGNALTVSSMITNQANSGNSLVLTKSGPGTLYLTGNNLYKGSTVINSGILKVDSIGDAGLNSGIGTNVGSVVYLRGGTLQYAGSGAASTARQFDVQNGAGAIDIASASGSLTISSNVASTTFTANELVKSGLGTLTLAGSTDNGNLRMNVQAGTLILAKTGGNAIWGLSGVAPAATVKYANNGYGNQIRDDKNWGIVNMHGTIDMNGASDAVTIMMGSGFITNGALGTTSYLTNGTAPTQGSTDVAHINTLNITDGGFGNNNTITLVKTGARIVALTGNNTYSGKTLIQNGTLAIDADSRLGAVPVSYVPDQITLGNPLVSSGTLQAARGSFSIAATRGIMLTNNATLDAAYGASMTINSIIAGTNSLTKTGPGAVVLANPGNCWTNGLTISGGSLKLGASGAIPNGLGKANVTVNGGTMGVGTATIQNFGTLDLNGYDTTINGLTVNVTTPGVGGVVLNNVANSTNTLTVGNANIASTISGLKDNNNDLGGVLVLRKIGTNTLALANYTNNHSGGFIFEGGRMDFTDDYSLGKVPAVPTTNLTFNGGSIRNNNITVAAKIATNRTINLLAGGGYFLAGYTPSTLTINGRITGVGALNFSTENSTNILTNPGNDYLGNTIVGNNIPYVAPNGTAPKLKLGASEVIPNGAGKGLLLITNGSLVDMAGVTETVNGLGAWGSAVAGTIDNSIGNANLIVGDANTNSSFNGLIKNTGGTLSLTKIGTGTLTLSGINTYSGGTTNASGILNINADAALGAPAPLVFSGNSTLQEAGSLVLSAGRTIAIANGVIATNDDQGFPVTINAPITGAGGLTKVGIGTLNAGGVNTYTGPTVITAGIMVISTGHKGGGSFTVNDGAELAVQTLVNGAFVPLSNLTLGSGAGATTLTFTNWSANAVFPTIWATNLTINSTVTININGTLLAGTYPLIKYSTKNPIAGNIQLAAMVLPRGITASLNDSGTSIDLVVGGSGGIVWAGTPSLPFWDVNLSQNWLFGGSPDFYLETPQPDAVVFDDSAAEKTVVLSNILSPFQITFSNSLDYSLSGTGKVSGAASIVMWGTGTNTINTTNDFSGPVFVNGGMLRLGNRGALGTASGPTTIASGATLDINGTLTNLDTIIVSGSGLGSNGAIVDLTGTGASPYNNLSNVTLVGDTTFGGVGRWDIMAGGNFVGNGYKLTKLGGNLISIKTTGSTGLGDIEVKQGALRFENATTYGDSAKTVTISTNAMLSIYNNGTVNKPMVVLDRGIVSTDSGTANVWTGTVTLNGTNTFDAGSFGSSQNTTLTLSNTVSGSGGLRKISTNCWCWRCPITMTELRLWRAAF
ncbi:MAG: autotransporter-associated beta strand repeat-containing protein [Verrucomicrobiota bacterium]